MNGELYTQNRAKSKRMLLQTMVNVLKTRFDLVILNTTNRKAGEERIMGYGVYNGRDLQ